MRRAESATLPTGIGRCPPLALADVPLQGHEVPRGGKYQVHNVSSGAQLCQWPMQITPPA